MKIEKNLSKRRSEYKTLIRNKKLQHDKQQTSKHETARFKNAKLYLKMLKEAS